MGLINMETESGRELWRQICETADNCPEPLKQLFNQVETLEEMREIIYRVGWGG